MAKVTIEVTRVRLGADAKKAQEALRFPGARPVTELPVP
jgi:hypothetical protein